MATELREATQFDTLEIDEENSVIKGVKVIGRYSKNKFEFPREVREQSHAILEGKFTNWNHVGKKDPEEKLENRFGWITGLREDVASDCTRGDLHYFKDHPHAKHFLSMARQNPKACGISVLGDGDWVVKDGRKVLTKLTRVKSLDLVADPANTGGLREAEDPEASGSEESQPGSSASDYGASGCVKAIEEIVAGGGTDREKLKSIKAHILKLEEVEGEEGEGKEGKEKMEESTREETRKACFTLCESHQVTPDDTLVSMLIHVPAGEREAMVKKYKRTKGAKTPQSGPTSIRESATSTQEETWDARMQRLGKAAIG